MLSIFVSLEVIYWKSSIALQWGRKVKVVTIKTIYWFYIPITYFYFHRALLTLESHERFPYPLDENSPRPFLLGVITMFSEGVLYSHINVL